MTNQTKQQQGFTNLSSIPQATATQAMLNFDSLVTVKQSTFTRRYQQLWQIFDEMCAEQGIDINQPIAEESIVKYSKSDQDILPSKSVQAVNLINKKTASNQSNISGYSFIKLYRQISQHYALAKQRHYSPLLVAQLHQRVMAGHQLIYQTKPSYVDKILTFLFFGFPAQLRAHRQLFWLAFALFYMPLIMMLIGCYLNHELIYSVMSAEQVQQMESMYNPNNAVIGRESTRQADSDIMMFGVYVYNNIGIDFRMYASGIFAGVGTILSTIYNGVVIGAVAGHLTQLGYGKTFWSFVCGHSAFELTAAIIASAAGLRLAQAIVAPLPYNRKAAFIIAGKQSIQLLLGAAMMTLLAAFVEAFWSSSSLIPNAVKYLVAIVLWGLVIAYLTLAGRGYQTLSQPVMTKPKDKTKLGKALGISQTMSANHES